MEEEHITFVTAEQWGTAVISIPEGSHIETDLRFESVLEGVLVTGTANSVAHGECVRCLDAVEIDQMVDITALFAYPERAAAAAEAGADEDDETFLVEHDRIDLEPVIRDSVVTALPFQPLCQADCPGLCSECGIHLADDPDHQHESIDPRWAALQDAISDADASDDMKES